MQQVKYLLEQIEHICYKLKNRTEISIIDKYALNAKRKTITVVGKTKLIVFNIYCLLK